MPTNYRFTDTTEATSYAYTYLFDDVFVPADAFRQGNLWSWGRNSRGNLGNNNTTDSKTPITTFSGGANWKQVSSSTGLITAAIKTDGTLWTWGRNLVGSIGDNTTTDRSTPVTTFAGGTNWKQCNCNGYSTAAIKTDGTLWVWGSNTNGQLGDNTAIDCITPITTFAGGTNWKQVSGGAGHTAAIKTDGTLWIWGSNTNGQLGINNTTQTQVCTPVTTFTGGTNWNQVASSNLYTIAIKTDGTLWTWGRNLGAQLGDNTLTSKNTPVTTFAGGTNWKEVSATGAIKTDGTLWVWGQNTNGELGDNTSVNRCTPVTTFAGGTNWKQLVGGLISSTYAVKTDGTLWSWGQNIVYGAIGDNTLINRSTPVTTFLGGNSWKQVACGANYGQAITYMDDYVV